jgi:para-aminobenzoate synthetase component 1
VIHSPARTALALREISPACDPLAAFERLRAGASPWLLDSALRSDRLGRFSFAGSDPWLVVRAQGGRVELDCRRAVGPGLEPGRSLVGGDFFETLRSVLPRLPADATRLPLPFLGGAVVMLGYELAEGIEDLGSGAPDDLGLPDAVALLVDRVLAWDHREERLYAAALGFGSDAGAAGREAERAVRELEGRLSSPPGRCAPRRAAGARRAPFAFFDEGSYAKAVDAVKEEVEAGNVYQACLTHRLEQDHRGDPWALYRTLRRLNPAPFACYLELPEVAVVGSSPERFLRHAAEDAELRGDLEASPKDRAENLMIVDLVRNDLGRVCQTGSVAVPELMAIEAYASVFQMVSTVSGRLRDDRDAIDLLRATFPPGSMTGAPKIAAMRLLRRLEPVRRGVYSGAVGYLDARGGADLAVVIRTLLLREGRAYLHTGGAVVADSEPRDEWRETLDKARLLLAALREADASP